MHNLPNTRNAQRAVAALRHFHPHPDLGENTLHTLLSMWVGYDDLTVEETYEVVHAVLHPQVVATWTSPAGSVTTVTACEDEWRFSGRLGSGAQVVDDEVSDRAALARLLADLEDAGHVPADDGDTRSVRAVLELPGWGGE